MNREYSARRLPGQPGPAAWNRLLPEPPPPRVLDVDTVADVVIIGAGFAGLTAAWRLLELDAGLNVMVLEAGRLADGPAGRNSGFMIDLPHDLSSDSYGGASADRDRRETRLNRAAIAYARGIASQLSMPIEVFNPCGKINAAATDKGDTLNRDYARHLDLLREPHEALDAADMEKLTGSPFFTSGLHTPGTVMLQPAAYIRRIGDDLARRAAIYENSPVLEFHQQGDAWQVKTPEARVSADRIILANNGHAESFGFFRRRLMHVFTYASMTERIPPGRLGGEPTWSATPADPMGTTVRRIDGTGGNRLVIRCRFTANPGMEVGQGALESAAALHDRKFHQRFPMLNDIPMAWRWAGLLCLSLNNVPAHGEVAPGVFAAVCQNGLGTAKGTLAGMSAAELALGRRSAISDAMTSFDPPRKLPPEPFSTLGANTLMRWKEWRAGNS